VNEALDMLLETPREIPQNIDMGKSEFPDSPWKFPKFPDIKALIEEKEKHIEEKERHIDTLKKELETAAKDKEDLKEQLKSNDENQLLRITDLKEEISILHNELTNKNDTIKNLTTITESQLKGYKLIEASGTKKPWWKFW
jgi:predicted RNase H-like nuclease (RuvC/YqgF family)